MLSVDTDAQCPFEPYDIGKAVLQSAAEAYARARADEEHRRLEWRQERIERWQQDAEAVVRNLLRLETARAVPIRLVVQATDEQLSGKGDGGGYVQAQIGTLLFEVRPYCGKHGLGMSCEWFWPVHALLPCQVGPEPHTHASIPLKSLADFGAFAAVMSEGPCALVTHSPLCDPPGDFNRDELDAVERDLDYQTDDAPGGHL